MATTNPALKSGSKYADLKRRLWFLLGAMVVYRVGTHSLHVLHDLDFEVNEGELVSIMGASGSGKSTLLNILGILDDYDSGEYWLGDTLIRDLSEKKAANYRNRFIGFVFQSFNLLPFKTALENVALPLYYQGISRRKRNQIGVQFHPSNGENSEAAYAGALARTLLFPQTAKRGYC